MALLINENTLLVEKFDIPGSAFTPISDHRWTFKLFMGHCKYPLDGILHVRPGEYPTILFDGKEYISITDEDIIACEVA